MSITYLHSSIIFNMLIFASQNFCEVPNYTFDVFLCLSVFDIYIN